LGYFYLVFFSLKTKFNLNKNIAKEDELKALKKELEVLL